MSIKYDINSECITIYDSYKIKDKKTMVKIINKCLKESNWKETNRTLKNMLQEWYTHNRAYSLGYKKDHSKDCDFERILSKENAIKYALYGFYI